jgi:acyl-CoA synthetase (AMP-forming)/AMP-acid ligase II
MLDELPHEAAKRFGDATAYVSAAGWGLSYRELDELSDEVAVGLANRSIGPGDVVALAMPSLPEYVVAYLAAAKLGAITAGVNDRLSEGERCSVLSLVQPRLVLATTGSVPDGPLREAEVLEIEPAEHVQGVLAGIRQRGESPPPLHPDPDRPVAIVFTSGTTGMPKGAVFANRQLQAITAADIGDRWGGGGRTLAGTSFAHLGFMTKLAGALRSGGTTFLINRWHATEALELTERYRFTNIGGIPTQVALMLQAPGFDDRDLSSVQLVVMGGGPATGALVRAARDGFAAPVCVRYSCTEAGIGLGTGPDDSDEDAEVSVGRARPGIELSVRDEDGRVVGTGQVGEVSLRSAAVMAGYHRDPEATRAAFTTDGAVRTGDLGWVDDRARLRLVGRTKEMYVRGGYNVYPMEVEGVLAEHPGVAEVAVVPQPDPVMGEIGVAVVVPRPPGQGPELDELRAFAAPRLAGYKLPEEVEVVDALPRTPMEKVDRRALKESVVESHDGERRGWGRRPGRRSRQGHS